MLARQSVLRETDACLHSLQQGPSKHSIGDVQPAKLHPPVLKPTHSLTSMVRPLRLNHGALRHCCSLTAEITTASLQKNLCSLAALHPDGGRLTAPFLILQAT